MKAAARLGNPEYHECLAFLAKYQIRTQAELNAYLKRHQRPGQTKYDVMTHHFGSAMAQRLLSLKINLTKKKETMTPETEPRKDHAAKIAALNDMARKAMGVACTAIETPGFRALPELDRMAIRQKVETFNGWTKGGDPYGERDFGLIEHKGHRVYFKIDYYAKLQNGQPDFVHGSKDPSSPALTTRVLTIMLSEEY
jgi:uncharacterized protein DUF3768